MRSLLGRNSQGAANSQSNFCRELTPMLNATVDYSNASYNYSDASYNYSNA